MDQQTQPLEPRPLRSFVAVIAGFVATVVTTTLIDVVLMKAGIFPGPDQMLTDDLFLIAVVYRMATGIFGCFIAAKLAPYYPMRHAMALAGFAFIMSAIGVYVMWDKGPAWYSILIVAITLPCGWIGGKLYEKQKLKHEQNQNKEGRDG
jgi:hypothetical protein